MEFSPDSKIVKHIAFYYNESRLQYLNQLIDVAQTYTYDTDIFIHTHQPFDKSSLHSYSRGLLEIVVHTFAPGEHPFTLPWKCRDLLKTQKHDYDIFMYVEDDILVPQTAIDYWIQYKSDVMFEECNLGFIRIEIDERTKKEYLSDLEGMKYPYRTMNIEDMTYLINETNTYCAFWIYDKTEFGRWTDSVYYDINNITGYDTRERSAIGLHGIRPPNGWYKYTVFPLVSPKQIVASCKIYHLPNNYVSNPRTLYATILFDDCIE
jgi:hypothetical protein